MIIECHFISWSMLSQVIGFYITFSRLKKKLNHQTFQYSFWLFDGMKLIYNIHNYIH